MGQQMRRCDRATNELAIHHHDEECVVPFHDDRKWFEFLVLEGAQAGLRWDPILKRRQSYRAAFDGFDPAAVARYEEKKFESLLADTAINRKRLKVASASKNPASSWMSRGC
jgi:DNA-3-methyladenine glycosylase I